MRGHVLPSLKDRKSNCRFNKSNNDITIYTTVTSHAIDNILEEDIKSDRHGKRGSRLKKWEA